MASVKVIRLSDMWTALSGSFEIDPTLFPDLTWESEPSTRLCYILKI